MIKRKIIDQVGRVVAEWSGGPETVPLGVVTCSGGGYTRYVCPPLVYDLTFGGAVVWRWRVTDDLVGAPVGFSNYGLPGWGGGCRSFSDSIYHVGHVPPAADRVPSGLPDEGVGFVAEMVDRTLNGVVLRAGAGSLEGVAIPDDLHAGRVLMWCRKEGERPLWIARAEEFGL